ncbi:DNA polymerase III subunit beta [Candidatus Saccharibacteria bacterium]|nr:DNA polymerase III subunit beta [Candidatus Saccharibacteria bacterium]
MKLQVTQENLNRALGAVARVANSRNQLPILSNVLIKTDNNRLSISATNLDIGITQFIGAKISSEGSITVPARLMQDYINSLPSGTISLELKESKLHISSDQYQSVVNGILADDFPVMPAIQDGKKWSIAAGELKKALQQVTFAASADESRPVLTGVLCKTDAGQLRIAATDSYRLAEKTIGKVGEEVNLLIPASSMHDLLRILGDTDEIVSVTHDEQQVLFQVAEVELVTRLLEGNYPDYRKLIPETFQQSATLKRADFVNITKVSSLFARESAGSITLHLNDEKQLLSIHSVASQLGENTSEATAKIIGSGDITLNSRYLLDGLQAFTDDEITFGFNGKLEPTILRSGDKSRYVHVVMPLKS